MRLNKLLIPLTFSMLFSNAALGAADVTDFFTEPTNCYYLMTVGLQLATGLGLYAGEAVQVCSGTTDAAKTVRCYAKAIGSEEDGGLGLRKGLAIKLCKSNSETFFPD